MNQLYRPTYIVETTIKNKDTIEILKYVHQSCYIKYGVPNDKEMRTTDWKDFLLHIGFIDDYEGNKDRKGRLWAQVDYTDRHYDRCQRKVYKSQFISAKSYTEFKIIDPKDIRMRELVNDLSAEEFILYLKDNGIGELQLR